MMQISEEYFEELNRQSKRLSDLLWGLIQMEDCLYKEECRIMSRIFMIERDDDVDDSLNKLHSYKDGLQFGIDIIRSTRKEYYEKSNKYNIG